MPQSIGQQRGDALQPDGGHLRAHVTQLQSGIILIVMTGTPDRIIWFPGYKQTPVMMCTGCNLQENLTIQCACCLLTQQIGLNSESIFFLQEKQSIHHIDNR